MPVINGDNGNNILNDTAGDDTVNGLDGDDTITVTAGYDSANGGNGDDRLIVSYGSASVAITGGTNAFGGPPLTFGVSFGAFEHFTVTTGSGNDTIHIEFFSGNDVVSTGAGDDSIITGDGNDTVNGGADNDLIDVGTGNDTADGGSGNDRISANLSAAASAIVWNLQTNSYSGPTGSFTNFEYFGTATTGSGSDTIVTGTGDFADGVNLEGGDDSVTVVAGDDIVNGGSGTDTLIVNYAAATTAVTGGTTAFADGGGLGSVTFTQFERFVVNTGSGNDAIHIEFFDGNDVVSTGAGADSIITGLGDDTANGEAGNDLIDVGSGDDTADGGSGNDRISANLSAAASAIVWNLQTNFYSGPIGSFTNFEYMVVTTGSGNDTVVTRTGNFDDGVNLEGGDDSVTVANGNDTVNGGSGFDTLIVNYRAATVTVTGGFNDFAAGAAFGVAFTQFERFVVNTGSGNDSIAIAHLGGDDVISTGAGDDYIDTNSGNDVLNGGAGADEMHGGLGDDLYYVDSIGDQAIEGADAGVDQVRASIDYALGAEVEILTLGGGARVGTGNALANTIFGAGGADTLSGLAGDDIVRGKNARDELDGGDGDDLLDGGVGKDTMTGGSGQDTFQFRDGDFGGTRSVADVITDFSQADGEKIRLNLVDADTTLAGNQAFAWIGNGAFTGVAGQLHYVHAGGNTYVEGDLDGDSVADIFINLTGTMILDAADFVL